jgi:intraflagellar transport protein 140
LVIVTVDVVLYKYRISADYKLTNERKVKLSIKGDGSELQCVWAGSGLLAAANGEPMVRFWSMESDENYVLSIADPKHNAAPKDIVRCLAFNPRKRVLAAGTVAGRVCMWHYIGPKEDRDPSDEDWDILPSIDTQKSVFSLNWGPGEGLLGMCSREMASILNETVLHCKTHASGAVIQMSSDRLFLSAADGKSKKLSTAIRIKGMDVNGQYIVVWNGKKAEVREQKEGSVGVVSSFATRAKAMVLHGDDIYQAVPGRVEVLNLQGVVKKALSFTEVEGNPLHLDACGDYIACSTSTGRIMLWNVERSETKQIVPGRMMEEWLATSPPSSFPFVILHLLT